MKLVLVLLLATLVPLGSSAGGERPNGYAFRLPAAMLVQAAEWVSLEQTRDEGPLWLRVTGSEGVKKFIRDKFGL